MMVAATEKEALRISFAQAGIVSALLPCIILHGTAQKKSTPKVSRGVEHEG